MMVETCVLLLGKIMIPNGKDDDEDGGMYFYIYVENKEDCGTIRFKIRKVKVVMVHGLLRTYKDGDTK